MPLPKTATIAAKATEVYCEVWSVLLQRLCNMPPTRNTDLNDLSQLLPYLRQLLTCCACAGLLDNAMISLACGHCYCFDCQFKEPLLKISCRQCRGRTGLVTENQLQLLVTCYKHMCHILGDELRKDPTALGMVAVKDEPNTTVPEEQPNVGNEDPINDKENPDVVSLSESAVPLKKKINSIVTDPNFDPVSEIVREVEKGMKVSRATLVVKPPFKYLNTKAIPGTDNAKKQLRKEKGNTHSTKEVTAPIDSADHGVSAPSGKVSSVGKDAKRPAESTAKSQGSDSKKRKIKKLVIPKAKVPKRTFVREERVVKGNINSKTKQRKSLTLSLSANGRRKAPNGEKMGVMSDVDGKKPKVVPKTEPGTAEGEASTTTVDHMELPVPPTDTVYGSEMEVSCFPVSVHCLNDRYLEVMEDTVTLLPRAQPVALLGETLSVLRSAVPWKGQVKTSYADSGWEKTTRKRRWAPLCPSVVVKRHREVIAQVVLIQRKAAKGRRKVQYKQKQQQKHLLEQSIRKSSKTSKSLHPPVTIPHFPTSAVASPTVPHPHPLPPSPPSSLPPDIPLPDNLPILPNDVSSGLSADDFDWKELSDFLESNDEESLSSLPPPLSRFPHHQHPPPPHHHPPRPHRLMDQVHFNDFGPGPRHHMMPPPFMHPPPPGHLHLPPPPPHLPHHGPHPPHGPHRPHHPPMMPFTPTLRPDMAPPPDGFFPPMMGGPDDFHGGGGMGPPDGGVFPGPMTPQPMTPQQNYPPGGMYQPPPGHHFPMPSPGPRLGYPQPFPPPPRATVTPKQPPKSSTMAKMVGKMKIKTSPVQQQQKQQQQEQQQQQQQQQQQNKSPPTATGSQGDGKKRKSPGYSEAGWRCRCGTNNVMFPDKVCAKGKCPCYTKGVACKNCLCRHCHNPFGAREVSAGSPADAAIAE